MGTTSCSAAFAGLIEACGKRIYDLMLADPTDLDRLIQKEHRVELTPAKEELTKRA